MLALCCFAMVHAQYLKPVKVETSLKETSPTEAVITFVASIQPGWHMYSTEEVDGPIPTTLTIETISGAKLEGALKHVTPPIKKYEEMFGTDVYYFEKTATFTQKVKLLGGKYVVEGYLKYGACNDQNCTPPTSVDFSFKGETAAPKAEEQSAAAEEVKALPAEEVAASADSVSSDSNVVTAPVSSEGSIWTPVIDQLSSFEEGGNGNSADSSLWQIFLLGLLGGLVALVTPCVWPIIPMTVSFFLKRGTTKKSSDAEKAAAKKRGIRDAILYGISIIVIYVTLGLVITAIFGASALNDLATNAVFNILFFLMLLIFGISFIGGFEITLPSKWNTAVDNKANSTTGLLSIFLMAFTLVLVSFSCTGPIIGFLLVQVVGGGHQDGVHGGIIQHILVGLIDLHASFPGPLLTLRLNIHNSSQLQQLGNIRGCGRIKSGNLCVVAIPDGVTGAALDRDGVSSAHASAAHNTDSDLLSHNLFFPFR